ncbi:hypothetical protein [Marininema halotolerans]|uniref:Uncharacterized protein n=1 Tax=Marininema halotolerans TaxID=1155944 RepID=A0A1I6R846_9BACL|nr:hypothetical protein [Marininema halotolerans]SFS60700.1 hypothetical protein SAMN05444972_104226 [Marininema halotolerans]
MFAIEMIDVLNGILLTASLSLGIYKYLLDIKKTKRVVPKEKKRRYPKRRP